MLGKIEEAAACYRQAGNLDPPFADAHNNLGSALLLMRKPEEALKSLQQSARLKPDFPETQRNLATALMQLARPEEARAFGLGVVQLARLK